MDRRSFLLGSLGLALGSAIGHALPRQGKRPNLVLFVTDDQQQNAMSAYGNTILKTPNMDRIAKEGVLFKNAFVTNALCGPSRASILTGVYSHVHGVISNGDGPDFVNQPGIPEQCVTFPEYLQRAGYHTLIAGKWHLNTDPRGFDQWVILRGQGVYNDPEFIANGAPIRFRGYVDDIIVDQAIEMLNRRPKDAPFLLLCQFKAPHRAWIPPKRHEKAFEDTSIPFPPQFFDDRVGRAQAVQQAAIDLADLPDFNVDPNLPRAERLKKNLELLTKNYYRVLLGVDDNVGRMLDYLEKNHILDDTAIFYTSDNGFFLGEHGFMDKRLMYEPSIRVPFLVRYPAFFKGGQENNSMVLNVDFAPTFLHLAGISTPHDMQGKSIVPLPGNPKLPWRQSFLYEYYEYPAVHCVRKHRGVRTERYKLLHFWERPEEFELYDLQKDPEEAHNLANDSGYQDVKRNLQKELAHLRSKLGDFDPPDPAPVAKPCTIGIGDVAPREGPVW
jgi:arylsulfatase A-like enzyme